MFFSAIGILLFVLPFGVGIMGPDSNGTLIGLIGLLTMVAGGGYAFIGTWWITNTVWVSFLKKRDDLLENLAARLLATEIENEFAAPVLHFDINLDLGKLISRIASDISTKDSHGTTGTIALFNDHDFGQLTRDRERAKEAELPKWFIALALILVLMAIYWMYGQGWIK